MTVVREVVIMTSFGKNTLTRWQPTTLRAAIRNSCDVLVGRQCDTMTVSGVTHGSYFQRDLLISTVVTFGHPETGYYTALAPFLSSSLCSFPSSRPLPQDPPGGAIRPDQRGEGGLQRPEVGAHPGGFPGHQVLATSSRYWWLVCFQHIYWISSDLCI